MLDQRTAPYGVLLLRVSLGALFWAHLYWKFFVLPGGLTQWWGNFATDGYPWFVPWYAISAEFVGALLLIPGNLCPLGKSLCGADDDRGGALLAGPQGFLFHRGGLRTPDCLDDPAAHPGTSRRRTLSAQAIAASWNFQPPTDPTTSLKSAKGPKENPS